MATSPNWKKPTDVMKRRLIRKRTSSSKACNILATHSDSQDNKGRTDKQVIKRKNPFARGEQDAKRQRTSEESLRSSKPLPQCNDTGPTISANTQLFEALNQSQQLGGKTKNDVDRKEILAAVENRHNLERLDNTLQKQTVVQNKSKDAKQSRKFYPIYPMDWCLKTKVRYISAKPFSWCSPLKSREESAGLMQHMKQAPCQSACEELVGESEEAKSELQRCCLLWSHPHIPWLKTFPRVVNDTKIGKPSAVFHSEEMQKALLNDWTASLNSLFALLRCGHCPYFYLCSHICTVLFRGAGSHGGDMDAIVTPTTRGFREALKEEGVEFEMPLNKIRKAVETEQPTEENQVSSPPKPLQNATSGITDDESKACDDITANENGNTENTETDDVDDDITQTDEGASSWLATLGIDRAKYRSLDPNKVKLQRDSFKMIDNRPESAVYVEGPNCMALFNFLLNCRSLVNSTGELAGVPPSLIAPVPFKSATLVSLLVKQGSIRQQLPDGGYQEAFSVELTGPILPDMLHHLHQLFRKTQGDFTTSCSVQETTTPFNMCVNSGEMTDTVEEYLENNDGSAKHRAAAIAINDRNNGRQAIREFSYENGLYSWA